MIKHEITHHNHSWKRLDLCHQKLLHSEQEEEFREDEDALAAFMDESVKAGMWPSDCVTESGALVVSFCSMKALVDVWPMEEEDGLLTAVLWFGVNLIFWDPWAKFAVLHLAGRKWSNGAGTSGWGDGLSRTLPEHSKDFVVPSIRLDIAKLFFVFFLPMSFLDRCRRFRSTTPTWLPWVWYSEFRAMVLGAWDRKKRYRLRTHLQLFQWPTPCMVCLPGCFAKPQEYRRDS